MTLFNSEPKQTNTQKLFLNHLLTKFLIPFGAVLIAAVTLLTTNYQLPRWAILVVVLYLIIVMVIVLQHPLIRLISLLRGKQRKKRFAKTFYPPLHESAREFTELIEERRSDTMLCLLQEINGWDELRNQQIKFDPEHITTILSWLESIKNRLTSYRPKDFTHLAWDLSSLISQYNRLCVRTHTQLEPLVTAMRLPGQRLRHLKQGWNLRRESHIRIIQNWENISKKINETAGERICIDYYEPLKTLE